MGLDDINGGYTGRYLDVDLTGGGFRDMTLPPEQALPFIGGKGVAALLLHRLLPRGVDPLSPQNVVVINTGPLTATGTPGSSRSNLSTKSPLTGLIATANCGGLFGLYLKRAGYDGLILRGKAPKPVWLEIDDAGARLSDASSLWGKGALEVQEPTSRKQGKIAIGPAGEKMVKFACVMSGGRAFARCGVGAVLGSKNLKGATASGSGKAPVNDPSAIKEVIKAWASSLKSHPVTRDLLHEIGTSVLVNRTSPVSILPTRNFQQGGFEACDQISGERLKDEFLVGNEGCYACPVRCGRLVKNPYGEGQYKGPEYETLALLGSNICNSSLGHIIEWNHLCDELGMDTISSGAVLGTAMELAEKGELECDLRFGETAGVSRMLEDIAYRRGVGDLLAEGALRLAESRGMPEIAPHSKGLELPAYHPRFGFGHALGYATANRGGCHINGGYLTFFEGTGIGMMDPHEWRGKHSLVVLMQNLMEGVSSAGGCVFSAFTIVPHFLKRYIDRPFPPSLNRILTFSLRFLRILDHMPKRLMAFNLPASYFPFPQALEAVTGARFNLGLLLESGERIWNLERLLNLREGLDPRSADTLSGRMIGEDKAAWGEDVPIDKMMPYYYRARGWDTSGRPKPKTLNRLDLSEMLG